MDLLNQSPKFKVFLASHVDFLRGPSSIPGSRITLCELDLVWLVSTLTSTAPIGSLIVST